MTWQTIEEFKTTTGISGTDAFIEKALTYAQGKIVKKIFVSLKYSTNEQATSFIVERPYFMNITDGETVTTNDIDMYETNTDGYRFDITDLKKNIVVKEKRVVSSILVPRESRTLNIEYKIGKEWFADMLVDLQELQTLIASNYIFSKKPVSKLQNGLSEWSLNGVNVRFDSASMKQVIEDNDGLIRDLIRNLRPQRFNGVRMGYNNKFDGLRKRETRLI